MKTDTVVQFELLKRKSDFAKFWLSAKEEDRDDFVALLREWVKVDPMADKAHVDYVQAHCVFGAKLSVRSAMISQNYNEWRRERGLPELRTRQLAPLFAHLVANACEAKQKIGGTVYYGVGIRELVERQEALHQKQRREGMIAFFETAFVFGEGLTIEQAALGDYMRPTGWQDEPGYADALSEWLAERGVTQGENGALLGVALK